VEDEQRQPVVLNRRISRRRRQANYGAQHAQSSVGVFVQQPDQQGQQSVQLQLNRQLERVGGALKV